MIVANQIAIVKQPMSIATSSMSYMKLVTGDVLYGVVDTTSYNSFIATHIYWGNSLNGLAGTNQPRLTIPLSNLILSPKGQMPIQLVDGYKWVLVSMPNPKITSGDIDSGFFKFNAPFATQTNQPQTLDDMVNASTIISVGVRLSISARMPNTLARFASVVSSVMLAPFA